MVKALQDKIVLLLLASLFLTACESKKEVTDALFVTLKTEQTGISFSNDLAYDNKFNLFKYMYFYNGSGVGAADFNNDGLTDLFFGSNQHNNKLLR